jgi:hypothetical protein
MTRNLALEPTILRPVENAKGVPKYPGSGPHLLLDRVKNSENSLLDFALTNLLYCSGYFMTEQEPRTPKPLFDLGQVVGTPGALQVLEDVGQNPAELLTRHVTGDWGDLCDEDKEENEFSVEKGFRILSAYELETGVKIWVITEADRSATTLLLPEEY